MTAVKQGAESLINFERKQREQTREKQSDGPLDVIYRAYGEARYARRYTRAECGVLWSRMTLGYSLGVMLVRPPELDKLWSMAFENQREWKDAAAQQAVNEDVLRARKIRELLSGGA